MSSEALVSRPGPKPELTPQLQETIRGFVNAGASLAMACQAAGVKPDTCKKWMAKGRRGVEPYASFVDTVERARAMHRVAMQMVITGAAKRGDWRAAAHDQLRRERLAEQGRAVRQGIDALDDEKVILLYPVPVPEGAAISDLQLAEGHAIDTDGESVPQDRVTVAYEDPDE